MNKKDEQEIKDKLEMYAERALQDYLNEDVSALTPVRTDNYLTFFSAWGALLETKLAELDIEQNKLWIELRDDYKTVAETDRAIERTEIGILYKRRKAQLKAIDKVIRSCKQRMRRFEQEAYNIT